MRSFRLGPVRVSYRSRAGQCISTTVAWAVTPGPNFIE
jgi:hypothetical protein